MSRYEVDKLLRDLRRDEEMATHFRSDIETVLDRYKLDTTERELLKTWDIRGQAHAGLLCNDESQKLKPKN